MAASRRVRFGWRRGMLAASMWVASISLGACGDDDTGSDFLDQLDGGAGIGGDWNQESGTAGATGPEAGTGVAGQGSGDSGTGGAQGLPPGDGSGVAGEGTSADDPFGATEDAGPAEDEDADDPPFTEADWLWDQIPTNPQLDPNSAAIANHLASGQHIANLYDYGVPIYEANSSTPRHNVDCLENWGTCALEQESVPIPSNAIPSLGSDAAMVVIDGTAGKSYEFWQFDFNGGNPTTSWGGVAPLSGDGRGRDLPTGAGLSRLAGVVTVDEIRDGRIPHALVFSTDSACRTVFRSPATKTDGSNISGGSVCIPEGARIQLDPTIDVDAHPGLTTAERVVARALQQYGAYVIDNGCARMGFVFETPHGKTDPYPGVGFEWDYYGMESIPWNSLRVLAP